MKGLLTIVLMTMAAFAAVPVLVNAQTDGTAAPLSQPLVREGTVAARLSDVLKLGPVAGEAEAESALSAAGIAPRNGWIADYPVTPDIADELEASVMDAAETGILSLTKDAAVDAFRGVIAEYGLPAPADGAAGSAEASPTDYPDAEAMNNYYESEGPPVVTYYAPPSDYAYMYDWVPSPFWWSGLWFSGFFILTDFDVRTHRHGHKSRNGNDEFISNHFRDAHTGMTVRVDPAARANSGRTSSVSGIKGSPTLRTHSGSTCGSCHSSTPPAGGRSSGFSGGSRGTISGSGRGSYGGSGGGGWRR